MSQSAREQAREDAAVSEKYRVVIVDDEPLARDCIRLALRAARDVTIVAECGDGSRAVGAVLAQRRSMRRAQNSTP